MKEREQTTIRLPAELKELLQKQADDIGISFNGLVIRYLWAASGKGMTPFSVSYEEM